MSGSSAIRARPRSSASTASPPGAGTSNRSRPASHRRTACSRPTCAGTATRAGSPRGGSATTWSTSRRRSAETSRASGSGTRSAAGSRSSGRRRDQAPSTGSSSSTRRSWSRRPSRSGRRRHARVERRYPSFEEAIDRRYEESQLHRAPRALVEAELRHHLVEESDGWRYRYSQAAVVAAYGEMASSPPPFETVRIPTLLVLGERSYLPYDHLLDAHRERRSTTCSRSSPSQGATRCSGTRSTKPPPRSRAFSLARGRPA